MENSEEVFHFLEEFSKRKPITIPQELNDYLAYVARTGDPVYQWSLVKSLFKEKLLNVITDFYETTPGIDIPPYPNVDPFDYDIMKNSLIEKLDSFTSAPFTVQRICELLTCPRKQYNRVDKFMRAVEKNILVVSTREPGIQRHVEPENGEPLEPIVNGSDNNSEYNVDVEMEDVSYKENSDHQNREPQPSSSDKPMSADTLPISVENSEVSKQDTPMDTQEKTIAQYPTVTPLEHSINDNSTIQATENKSSEVLESNIVQTVEKSDEILKTNMTQSELKQDVEMKSDVGPSVLVIPEIKVDDAEMTEQKLNSKPDIPVESSKETTTNEKDSAEPKSTVNTPQAVSEDSCSSSVSKDDITETKIISEVSASSEESSSSSDNTDGNSNSPKADPPGSQTDTQIEPIVTSIDKDETTTKDSENKEPSEEASSSNPKEDNPPQVAMQSDNYSISDVNSELQQIPTDTSSKSEPETKQDVAIEEKNETIKSESEEKQNTIETPEQQD